LYDDFKATAIGTGADTAAADAAAGSNTFLKVAIMPAILIVVFAVVYFLRRKSQSTGKPATQAAH